MGKPYHLQSDEEKIKSQWKIAEYCRTFKGSEYEFQQKREWRVGFSQCLNELFCPFDVDKNQKNP